MVVVVAADDVDIVQKECKDTRRPAKPQPQPSPAQPDK